MNNLNHKVTQSWCLDNTNILVAGLGITGVSIIEYLLSRKLNFRVIDSRENPPNIERYQNRGFDIILGGLYEKHFVWADTILLSPGISENELVIKNARKNGKVILGDIALFLNEVKAPVVAITGSNGKSTVTSMMNSIAQHTDSNISIAGNIGIPALDTLQHKSDLYVLELSSFQLDTLDSMDFETSVILNLSEDHMDRYASFDDYCRSKLKLLSGNGNFILNYDDLVIQQYSDFYQDKENIIWFTLNEPSDKQIGITEINGDKWICTRENGTLVKLLNCAELNVIGEHNITNAMVALMISRLSGIDKTAIQTGLTQFEGLAHRSQLVKNKLGIRWINDSKATNIGATSAAILGLKNDTLILIMGGQSKGQDFSVLNSLITPNVKLIILFGEDAQKINGALKDEINRLVADNLESAVSIAKNNATTGDIVLFSPACASFDMFNNFEHRGVEYTNLVRDIN
ncbi:UDP-N-acetylmuramoylalanine--D-glutamate ligase [hydrothermal vent metagenome]|uniref:UDP-N-acetylmuramoylalanine--D-glutamate ligase n=1 Tax=hydrothermal vent metagenome TaxID=652676 RepID=A0A3B1ALK1_9ZZZZ